MHTLLALALFAAIQSLAPHSHHLRLLQPQPAARPVAPDPIDAPADRVSIDRLIDMIASLPTKRAARGDTEHQEGLLQTESIIVQRLKALGYEPTLEIVDAIGLRRDKPRPFHNVIVEIKGRGRSTVVQPIDPGTTPQTSPTLPDSPIPNPADLLIVGAHFDAVPRSPGADDNGTGVAALIELARILKDYPMTHDVRLCFFNLEECGLVGSTIHAAAVKDAIVTPQKQKIIGMISLDMLGYYSAEPGSQKSPIPEMEGFKPPDTADFIAMATTLRHRKFSQALTKAMKETAPGLKVVTVDFLPIALPDLLRSDHAPFLAIGVPAVIVSDTAEFRSKHYHRATDTIDTLDRDRFLLTVKGLVGAVHRLAVPFDAAKALPARDADASKP